MQPASSPIAAGSAPQSVAIGDFNRDGKPDFAVANNVSGNVTILLNNDGGFSQAAGSPVGAGSGPRSVVVGDFNVDGKVDLAVANVYSDNVTILLGNGTGGFNQPSGSPVDGGTTPICVAVGDFNLDGKPDLALANFRSNAVTILLGDGGGGFAQAAGSPVGVGTSPGSVAVGDFNLDGKVDLAVSNADSDNVSILLGNGNGGFTQPVGSPVGAGDFPISVAAGDFDLDGTPDLAVASANSHNITILSGDGGGGFVQALGSPVSLPSAPISVAVGDFNLDGKPDLAAATSPNHVTILMGNGVGGFVEPAGSPLGAGAGPFSVAVGDFNLDGKPDLAIANQDSNSVTIQLNTCDAFPCSGVGFMQPAGSPVGAGSSPVSEAVGDFNLDGKSDLAVVNFPNTLTILLGNGSGGFIQSNGSPIGVGTFPSSVAVGDINLDGKPDLIVANEASNDVTILLGDGSGGFTQPADSPISAGNAPFSVAVGDFNLDGKLDLAVADDASNNVTILLGNGLGGFAQSAGSPFAAGIAPVSIAVGDFNRDGKPDLAVGNNFLGNVTILLGDGSGAFTQAVGSPISAEPDTYSVVSGDFNRDGRSDLAVVNRNSNNVTILLGNGSGGFAQATGSPVSVGSIPDSLVVGDFNLDGKADLAVANFGSNNVTILMGDGSGGFTNSVGSPVNAASNPYSVVAGDFNRDGKPDLAVANHGSNNATILLNTCLPNIPPTITCPANVSAITNQSVCPSPGCAVVSYPAPVASGSGSVTVSCTPASGSCFSTGATSVTCTATDGTGNHASCSFAITVFDECLQDDSNGSTVLLFSSLTGDYSFCCGGTTLTGRGTITRRGCLISLNQSAGDRRLTAQIDKGVYKGSATMQSPPGAVKCVIADRDIRNNTCKCP